MQLRANRGTEMESEGENSYAADHKTVGCMVIDKKNAVIAAMAAVFCGIAGFVIRHHAAR